MPCCHTTFYLPEKEKRKIEIKCRERADGCTWYSTTSAEYNKLFAINIFKSTDDDNDDDDDDNNVMKRE